MSTEVRNRWLVPTLCGLFGLLYLGIGLDQHNWGFAIGGLVIMLGYGAFLLLFGRRSEAVGLLGGALTDERRIDLQRRAAASTAHILIIALVAGAVITTAVNSRYSGMFAGLCALGGLSWIGSTVWYARRG